MGPTIRGNSLYTIVAGPSWAQAEANSTSIGGHLTSINDSLENQWYHQEIARPQYFYMAPDGANGGGNPYWLGASDRETEGHWRWLDGTDYGLQDFNPDADPTNNDSEDFLVDYGSITDSGNKKVDGSIAYHWDDYSATASLKGIAELPLALSVTQSSQPKEGAGVFTTSINLSAGTQISGNLAEGATVYWKMTGITADDLASGALTGSGTITNGKLDLQHSLKVDADTGEQFAISVYSDSAMTQQIGSTYSVAIREAPPAPTPSVFSIASTDVWEGDTASVVVTRTGGTNNAITLTVATTNGTAKSGSDYTAILNSALTLQAGETSKTILVSTNDDTVKESDETFSVGISSSDPLAQFASSSATVTIDDNDQGQTNATTSTNTGNNNSSVTTGSGNSGNVVVGSGNNVTTGNSNIANTNENNNNVVIGNGNTTSNTTVVNNVTTNINSSVTNNTNTTNNVTNNATNNYTSNTTNNITNNTLNLIGSVTVDLSRLIQGGSAASDVISGSTAADVLGAGQGPDKLTGGAGADQFVFNTPDAFGKKGADQITDFNPSQGDKLALSPNAFPGLSDPSLTSVASKKSLASAQKGGAAFIYYQPLGQLFYNQNGTGKGFGSGGLFAVLLGTPQLTMDSLGVME